MKFLRNISSLLLITVMLAPLATPFFMQLKIASVKAEMEEKLEKSILHTLEMPVEKIVWVEKGKEIKVNGHLFDVKTIRIENGKARLTGLFDKEEEALAKYLNQQQQDRSYTKLLVQCFSFTCDSPYTDIPHIQTPPVFAQQYAAAGAAVYNAPCRLMEGPPPRLA